MCSRGDAVCFYSETLPRSPGPLSGRHRRGHGVHVTRTPFTGYGTDTLSGLLVGWPSDSATSRLVTFLINFDIGNGTLKSANIKDRGKCGPTKRTAIYRRRLI